MKKRLSVPALACALLACLVLALGLTACGKPSPEESIRKGLTSELDTLRDNPSQEFVKGLEGDAADELSQLNIDEEQFAKEYLSGFAYEIGDITVDEDAGTATVPVSITIKSMNEVISTWNAEYQKKLAAMESLPTEDELYQMAGELMMAAVKTTAPKTTDVTLSYTRNKDGDWVPDQKTVASELLRALTA